MKLVVVTGSRADWGLLEPVVELMEKDPFFKVEILKIWDFRSWEALRKVSAVIRPSAYKLVLLLGDRFEIMGAAMAAHLARIPIAHIAGGDVTEGSYDDAMRDCISRMATLHFVTSTSAMARLTGLGYQNIHLVGNPGTDVIRAGKWKSEHPIKGPYVVISYQPETIDGTNEIAELIASLPKDKTQVFFTSNKDKGADTINHSIREHAAQVGAIVHEFLPHADFLNLIYHCDEFIGNSSSMLYEAPELGVKIRMVGKRQRGRVIPMGDGKASERIVKILKYTAGTL